MSGGRNGRPPNPRPEEVALPPAFIAALAVVRPDGVFKRPADIRARAVHGFFGSGRQYGNWLNEREAKRRVMVPDVPPLDCCPVPMPSSGGRVATDHLLSAEQAEWLAGLEQGEPGLLLIQAIRLQAAVKAYAGLGLEAHALVRAGEFPVFPDYTPHGFFVALCGDPDYPDRPERWRTRLKRNKAIAVGDSFLALPQELAAIRRQVIRSLGTRN